MKKLLVFNTVAVDTLCFQAGTTIHAGQTFELYRDYIDRNDDDVTKQEEDQILKWILSSSARELFFHELGLTPNAFAALSVRHPVIEHGHFKPGDIDILICDRDRADLAIGIQCKRVKVRALSDEVDDCNKIPDITGGIKQVNLQREHLGFHRNYLMIVIETYGRSRSSSNVLFRGPSRESFKQIYDFPRRESLHPDVGIIFVKVTQPTGKSFQQMADIGICVDKDAARLEQTVQLTNRIADYMRLVKESIHD